METERDRQNIIRTAEKKALAKGLAEGSRLKSLEIAKGMLVDGMPIETIVKYTGLTEAEITAVQQS